MIEIQDLSKSYNQLQVLKKISFDAKDGEVLGFLGPNGAGKTTTMKILTGFTAPTSGSIKINNVDVSRRHSIKVKAQIGYLPESVPLYDDMTVLEYLNFIADIRLADKSKAEKQEALQNFIQICGLKGMVMRLTGELSKGFRQRVCLAQALIHNPDILLLDEPTSGLDPNQIADIRKVIKEIGKKKTVILSTHILQEVQALCDRVIIINKGKIVAQGTTKELEKQSKGKRSVYVKMKGLKSSIHKLLLGLPEVESIDYKDSEGDGIFGFEVVFKSSKDARELIFKKAVESKTPILEMSQKKISLEDLFRQLTK